MWFNFRISEKEHKRLKRRAKSCGLSMSGYVRQIINGYKPRESPPADYFAMTREMKEIGNNMNQSDTVHFEVSKEKSLQEIQVETYPPGAASEDKPQGLTLKDYEHILPFAAAGMVLLAGLIVVLFIYRDSRKHSGGHR